MQFVRDFWICLTVFAVNVLQISGALSSTVEKTFTLDDFLKIMDDRGYDMRVRPGSRTDNITKVEMNIHFFDFEHIDELKWEYAVNVYFRQKWNDDRLKFPGNRTKPLQLHYSTINNLWQPDGFFKNSRRASSHDITVPNRLVRVYPDGTVFYSQKLTLHVACHMTFEKFPLDKQTCDLQIVSYAHTRDELQFYWREKDGVTIEEKLELPQFELRRENVEMGECSSGYFTGSYACLYVKFVLERKLGYYLSQIYIPSILVVILSWVSFWLDVNAIAARISLGVLSILTLSTQNSSVNQTLPKVSYIKAIDIWMATCLCFTFSALLEFALAHTVHNVRMKKKAEQEARAAKEAAGECNGTQASIDVRYGLGISKQDASQKQKMLPNSEEEPEENNDESHKSVDRVARVAFPCVFVVFNTLYWVLYTQLEFENQN